MLVVSETDVIFAALRCRCDCRQLGFYSNFIFIWRPDVLLRFFKGHVRKQIAILVLESSQANDVTPPGVLQTLVHSILAIQSQLG